MATKTDRQPDRIRKVEEVRPGVSDFACEPILCVYTYNPPLYAIYRTATRVMVHFADDAPLAAEQRKRIARLAPLRGQVSGLIDGWHSAKASFLKFWLKTDAAGGKPQHYLRKRADRYDRRSADAIGLALEGDVETAMTLLAEIKNDIISERTAIARIWYLVIAVAITAIALVALLVILPKNAPDSVDTVGVGIIAGTFGALFSVALGLKSRTVLIDLQNRMNIFDVFLRMMIGSMSGGILLCLLLSGLAGNVVKVEALQLTGQGAAPLLVFIVGFLGGFFERLVPDLLNQTNLGTKEASAAGRTAAAGGATTVDTGAKAQQGAAKGGDAKPPAGRPAPGAAPVARPDAGPDAPAPGSVG